MVPLNWKLGLAPGPSENFITYTQEAMLWVDPRVPLGYFLFHRSQWSMWAEICCDSSQPGLPVAQALNDGDSLGQSARQRILTKGDAGRRQVDHRTRS